MVQHIDNDLVNITRRDGASNIVLVCEHASHHIPAKLNDLGLSDDARFSHIAWDPGALGVAEAMSEELDAPLIAATVSRLVYDCNRPPEAHDAMPARSEVFDVPGNADLTAAEKNARVEEFYVPFHDALTQEIAKKNAPIVVTVHSFTRIYKGIPREVEIGVLHDKDTRLADAILGIADRYKVQRNEPYGPDDGVTHTLQVHGESNGHLNVMIEVRNDLIQQHADQVMMGRTLSKWLTKALEQIGAAACKV